MNAFILIEERKSLPGVKYSSLRVMSNRRGAATLNGGFFPSSISARRKLSSVKPDIRY
jgi:hypothetical protein